MAISVSVNEETQAIDYDTVSSMAIYQGWAVPGTPKTAAAWKICKFTLNASNQTTDIQWANGSLAYNSVWNNRAGLSYS
jgi:pantothenate kinase-related protein Tda10